ncbi:thioredoxin-like protein [Aeromonas phage 25]|uniref:Thioredoxin domain-containing protein n=1 Tax=Aeromonas phage 25 TaxID=2911441 RepID=Q19CR7_9CAUD|nr:thioredoxin-like protein [Aeromonas phage 25]ABF72658.1 hypothetical protein PHG25ORF099c [Aeromonas phage 25]
MIYLFGADWCAKLQTRKNLCLPNVDYKYIDVDSDEGIALTAKYAIRGLPTMINVETTDRFTGVPKNVVELKQKMGI